MSEKFGTKLRRERTAQKKTLEELAAATGTSKAYVWQLENKNSAKPSAELLLKIANYLGQSPDYFLDDSRDEPSSNQKEDAFVRKYKQLSDLDKRTMERIISSLSKNN